MVSTLPASDSGDSIDRCTNRGNKLKRKARYVQERQLDRPNGPKAYKRVCYTAFTSLCIQLILLVRQRIEHAGYYRNVISRNPKRYDVNGYRLEDDEEDEEADAAAAEEDPYSGVVLHGTVPSLEFWWCANIVTLRASRTTDLSRGSPDTSIAIGPLYSTNARQHDAGGMRDGPA